MRSYRRAFSALATTAATTSTTSTRLCSSDSTKEGKKPGSGKSNEDWNKRYDDFEKERNNAWRFRSIDEEARSRGHEDHTSYTKKIREKHGVPDDPYDPDTGKAGYDRIRLGYDPKKNPHIEAQYRKSEEEWIKDTQTQKLDDAARAGEVKSRTLSDEASEYEKFWEKPGDTQAQSKFWSGHQHVGTFDPTKKKHEGNFVPEVKFPPSPGEDWFKLADDNFFNAPEVRTLMTDDLGFDNVAKLPAPPPFDPALDDVDEKEVRDHKVLSEVQAAVDFDRKRLEAFGNPLTLEDTMDYLLQPTRQTQQDVHHRKEFNGFQHWGLLHAAFIAMDEKQDYKRAHSFVSRYLRDMDLFAKWLDHPKVNAHFKKKFNVEIKESYDRMAAVTFAMYVRSKIEVLEGDPGAALKSLTGAVAMLNEGADIKNNWRHQKLYGAALAARGMVYCQLKSYQRSVDDFTRATKYLPMKRAAVLYQLRAESYEGLGMLDEARADELRAADVWEKADTIHEGMEGEAKKFIV